MGIVSSSSSAADVDERERCSCMLFVVIATRACSRDEMCTQLADILHRKKRYDDCSRNSKRSVHLPSSTFTACSHNICHLMISF